ncbi:hypothetical protein HPB47_014078 [Ixodes persulcatus]|uniref:Uncharacterized protein n=1 Tax=Ixodes persulcatus TaxID=34615 RepID=A0AC60QZD1_IXOPE|nr:hypothetical protein HPB47_014078 [Ixodes persulcatus]
MAAMKVLDLKRELKARGLSTSGNKHELLERLQATTEALPDLQPDLSTDTQQGIHSVERLDNTVAENEEEVCSEANIISLKAINSDTEEYVDCAEELSRAETTTDGQEYQDQHHLTTRLSSDALTQATPERQITGKGWPATTCPVAAQKAKSPGSINQDSAPFIEIVGDERNQEVIDCCLTLPDTPQNEVEHVSIDKITTADYNCTLRTTLDCTQQTSQQERIVNLESQVRQITERLYQVDTDRKNMAQMALLVERSEKKWRETVEGREALVGLIARCEGLETRLNRLLTVQLNDLRVASPENSQDNQEGCTIKTREECTLEDAGIGRDTTSTSKDIPTWSKNRSQTTSKLPETSEIEESHQLEIHKDNESTNVRQDIKNSTQEMKELAQSRYAQQTAQCPKHLTCGSLNITQAPKGGIKATNRAVDVTIQDQHTSVKMSGERNGKSGAEVRPPHGVTREVIFAGDSNVARIATTLHDEVRDPKRLEILLNRKATVDVIHQLIDTYEEQARTVPRMYILHIGVNDILQGENPDSIVNRLQTRWSKRKSALAICSVPEIGSRGKGLQAATMLLNAKLKRLCKVIRAKFIDLSHVMTERAMEKMDYTTRKKE